MGYFMNAHALFYCISNFLEDDGVDDIELVGLYHSITISSLKVIDVEIRWGCLWITKQMSDQRIDQLMINSDQIVYVRGIKKEVLDE